MAKATIRLREEADFTDLAEALRQVHAVDGYPVTGTKDPVKFARPPNTLEAWVAVVGNRVVGQATITEPAAGDEAANAYVRQSGSDRSQFAVLKRLFVSPDGRGRQLGKMLISTAMTWATENNKRLVMDVLDKDQTATSMYEKMGWTCFGTGHMTLSDGRLYPEHFYMSP